MGSSSSTDSELKNRIHQQEVVAKLGQQALETNDLDRLMHDASVAVAETLDNEYCKVLELLPGGDGVLLRQGVGWREGLVGSATVPTDLDSQAGYTLLTEEPVIVDDLRNEDRFSGPDLLVEHDVVSGISVIIGSVDEPWGVLGTHTTGRRTFTEHDANFVQSVANVLASAIENERARGELQEREQHLGAIIETTPECIKTVAADGTLLQMNPVGLDMVQADAASDVIGESVYDLIAPEHREKFREFNERICRGERGTLQFDIVGLEGTRRHMESHAAPLRSSDGTINQVALTRDITERKERERELERYETVAEVASEVIVTIDERSRIQSANPAVEEVFGYERDELLGEPLTTLMPESQREQHRRALKRHLQTGERTLDWEYVELPGLHQEGHEVPLAISFSEYEHDGDRFFTGIIRDNTERKQFEQALTGLHEASRDLIQAKSESEASQRTIDAATDVLNLDGVGIYLFDDADNVLRPAAATEYVEDLVGELPTFAPGDTSITWSAFINGETITHDDVLESDDVHRSEMPLRSGIWVPLGDHGVLAIVSEEVGVFDERTHQLADHLAATTEATLDRIEHEESLREQEYDLAAQNRRLEDLNRMNDIIREIDQVLVQTTTKDAIEQAVCDRLTRSDRFAFAWIGHVRDGTVTPHTWAGAENGYLDAVSLSTDADTADPAVTTASAKEVTVVPNVATDLRSEPWRKAALARDLQSAIAVPIEHGELHYGVLTVYAAESEAFDVFSQDVLGELGTTIANAMNAVETRQALLTDSVVELELVIQEADDPLVRLATDTDGQLEIRGIVPQPGGGARVFVTASGVAADTILTAAAASTSVEGVTRIDDADDEDDECRFEVTVAGPTISSTLVECGAAARFIRIADDGAHVVAELPPSTDVRTFVDRLETTYPDTELVARRDRERDNRSSQAFETELTGDLTERQLEVLQTAYLSGYFEWPRDRTGEEVAESLDITQSTFNGHLRTAERKLFAILFDGRAASSG